MRERNYQIENVKIILIFCVIFGHLLESVVGGYNVYKIIYSFHMPMFLFINGWLAPHNYATKKTIFKLLYPYGAFQILYQLFNIYIINEEGVEFSVQFSVPYWLLWYLLSLTFYYLLIPAIATESREYAVAALVGTVILAIAVGFDNSIGYYMSLSRTFVFFPFFVFGYYIGHDIFRINGIIQRVRGKAIVKLVSVILMLIICMIMYRQNLNAGSLYGSFSYEKGGFPWYIRLEIMVAAFVWSGIFMTLVPNQKILGRLDTFPIYVLHGFVVLYCRKYNPFSYSLLVNLLIAALMSMIVILLFGNKYVSQIMKFLFRGEWIIKIWDRVAIKKYMRKPD